IVSTPVVALVSEPQPAAPRPVSPPPPAPAPESRPTSSQEVKLVSLDLPNVPPPKRRTFVDLTAHPDFAHARDYSWLGGTLEPGEEQGTWCVRYCSVDEEDRYGGSMLLLEPGPTDGFEYGRLVRVQGAAENPKSNQSKPPYRVRKLTLLK